jgi:cysteine synthase
VFKRLFWLAIGVGFGFGLSFWATRFVKRTAERYSPENMSDSVAQAVRALGADLRAAVAEGREGMREREAELRADLESREGRRR